MGRKSLLLLGLCIWATLPACNQGMQFTKKPENKFQKLEVDQVGFEAPVDVVSEEPLPPPTGEVPPDQEVELPAPPVVITPPPIVRPPVPPPVCTPSHSGAIVGQKGSMLLEILERGCNTRQRNERKGYVPPTRDELLAKLNRCGANIYVSTPFTSDKQKNTILGMMGDNPELINKMWRGLYYTPPYSDHFELYFGLEIGEAREFFCYDGQMFGGVLRTSEFWQYAHDRTWEWENNPEAQARDRAVQKIRSQLVGCVNQSIFNPADVTTVGDDTDLRNRNSCH